MEKFWLCLATITFTTTDFYNAEKYTVSFDSKSGNEEPNTTKYKTVCYQYYENYLNRRELNSCNVMQHDKNFQSTQS